MTLTAMVEFQRSSGNSDTGALLATPALFTRTLHRPRSCVSHSNSAATAALTSAAPPVATATPVAGLRFVELHDLGTYTRAELADLFGVSRSTIYRTWRACDQHHRSQSGHSPISVEASPRRSSFNGSGLGASRDRRLATGNARKSTLLRRHDAGSLRNRLPGATSNTATSTTERPAPYPPPKEAAQSRYAAQRRRPTLAISPYASSKCRPDRESVRCRGSSVGASRLGPTAV